MLNDVNWQGHRKAFAVLYVAFILIASMSIVQITFYLTEISGTQLPNPGYSEGILLTSAMEQCKSSGDLRYTEVDVQQISQLVWAMQGLTHGPGFRTVPSAGGTYPLEILLLHEGNSTLSEGCYYYIPQGHQLQVASSSCNLTDFLPVFDGEDQEAIANVSTVFVILADYTRTTTRYGNRGIQYVHLEVGHAIQNFLLQTTSLSLSTRVVTNFSHSDFQNIMDTNLEPLVVLPLGSNGQSPTIPWNGRFSLAEEDEITVEQAIAKRESIRDYLNGSIPFPVLLDILNQSTAIAHLIGSDSQLDFRAVAGEVQNLTTGLYDFNQEDCSLDRVSSGDLRPSLRSAGLDQQWIENAQLDIVISVDSTWIDQQSDPTFCHQVMMFEVGMMAQNVYLKCAAYGLGTVVIGAFYENEVSQVVETVADFKPIYIMPIGLTSEFYLETEDNQLQMTVLARASGVLAFVPLYCSLYLSVPTIKRRLPKRIRPLHCILGIMPLLGLVVHSMILHGHVRNFSDFLSINSYVSALFHFISGITSLPATPYAFAQFAAYLSVPLTAFVALSGIGLALRRVKRKKLFRKVHTFAVFLSLALLVIHTSICGVYFVRNAVIFILINAMAVVLYGLLHRYLHPARESDANKTIVVDMHWSKTT